MSGGEDGRGAHTTSSSNLETMYAAGTFASSSANSFSRHTKRYAELPPSHRDAEHRRYALCSKPDRIKRLFEDRSPPPSIAGVAVLHCAISTSGRRSKMVVIPRALSCSAVMHVGSPERKTRLHACAGSGGVCGAEVADVEEAFEGGAEGMDLTRAGSCERKGMMSHAYEGSDIVDGQHKDG